ncbi:hypothetical protein ANN_17506 [Periplaneta americana]|uniref:Reverse transcriptase domain-containing protein n=1 Tax=Periplaneta americana TaxID=6978 RepID=A0ABQ8ST51_PERAM|nr:hypothetical protein ANN_17506 [Periplaneta americana]
MSPKSNAESYPAILLRVVEGKPQKKSNQYADDMVLGSSNVTDLQTAVNRLHDWAEENELKINKSKTIMMIFRRERRAAAEDRITIDGKELEKANSFNYLGITLQTTGLSFRLYIRERWLPL